MPKIDRLTRRNSCQKCGCIIIQRRYDNFMGVEFLHCTCNSCDYKWFEHCSDHKPEEKKDV